jgi:hypothetical protein
MVRTIKKYLLFLKTNYIVIKVSMNFITRRKWVMKLICSKIGQKWCVDPNFILTRGVTPQCPIFIHYICYLKYWNSIKWLRLPWIWKVINERYQKIVVQCPNEWIMYFSWVMSEVARRMFIIPKHIPKDVPRCFGMFQNCLSLCPKL